LGNFIEAKAVSPQIMRMLKKLPETAFASIISGKMQKLSCRRGGKANCLTLRIKQFAFPYLPNLFFYRPKVTALAGKK
jgi:hypothetical protein